MVFAEGELCNTVLDIHAEGRILITIAFMRLRSANMEGDTLYWC